MFHLCCLSFRIGTLMICLTLYLMLFATIFFVLPLVIMQYIVRRRYKALHPNNEISVGFFHPYCNAGGGGERVLWCAIKAIHTKYPSIRCVVYTGDIDATPEDILNKVQQRFNITIEKPVEFVYLQCRKVVEDSLYPHFTLLGQSFGSCFLGLEALAKYVPTVYVDSMGYAFTLPIFRFIGGCRVGCYVHYPTISTDMLGIVTSRTSNVTNATTISSSAFLSKCKMIYYYTFAFMYGLAGKASQITMVNSSWTKSHILHIWRSPNSVRLVYPPCDVSAFKNIPLHDIKDKKIRSVVSVAQFRPEKDHELQIKSFSTFLSTVTEIERDQYRLILIGSCRNEDDERRVESLQSLASSLNINEHVKFKLNLSFEDLKIELEKGTIGLHTMWNEHFGIGVVECMAAGLIMLAHSSGGPKMDIVTEVEGEPTGFLASDVESFAVQMKYIFNLSSEEMMKIRLNARKSVDRFSEEKFNEKFLGAVQSIIPVQGSTN